MTRSDDKAATGRSPARRQATRQPDRGPASVGRQLRAERERQRIGLRELARRIEVSASLISQIELGRATPSVGTLYAIVNELNMSLDELFFEAGEDAADARDQDSRSAPDDHAAKEPAASAAAEGAMPPRAGSNGPVVRREERQAIHLASGVTWERMTPDREDGLDFLYVIYDVGAASAPEHALIRHRGREYGHLLEGSLNVTVGFETFELRAGDAISFNSTMPHRLFNPGDTPAKAIWCVVGRDDARFAGRPSPSPLFAEPGTD